MKHIDSTTDLTEKTLDGEWVYRGKLLHVRRDRVRLPDGNEAVREYIDHPGAVAVVAFLDDGRLVMERQHRYPIGRDLIEIPAGKIDPGEDPAETAKRELMEETGYVAESWRHLTTIHPIVAYCNERIELYLARGLRHVERALDDGEFLEVFPMSLGEGLAAVRTGRITDSKTIIGLFWAEKIASGAWREDGIAP